MKIMLTAFAILIMAIGAQAQTQTNGGFDSWGSLTGTGVAPAGVPTGWNETIPAVGVTRVAGLTTAGSNYAAMIMTGSSATSSGILYQTYAGTSQLTSFQLSFNLAVSSTTYSGVAANRLANVYINQAGSNVPLLNLAVFSTGASAGYSNTAGLYMYNINQATGSKWIRIGSADMTTSGSYDTATNTFSNLTVYKISLTVNNFSNSGLNFDVSYGLEGGATVGSATGVNYQNVTTGNDTNGVYSVQFISNWSGATTTTPYIVDNFVYGAVPESSSMALLMGSFLLLALRMANRKRCLC